MKGQNKKERKIFGVYFNLTFYVKYDIIKLILMWIYIPL